MFSELVKASHTFSLIPLELVDGRWINLSDRIFKLVRCRECDCPQTSFLVWNKGINTTLKNPYSATLFFSLLKFSLSWFLIISWANRAATQEEKQWQKKRFVGTSSIPAIIICYFCHLKENFQFNSKFADMLYRLMSLISKSGESECITRP